MSKKLRMAVTVLFLCAVSLHAQTGTPSAAYQKGYDAFSRNNPQDAIVWFQQALVETSVYPLTYNYLGLCYYQTGQFQKSLDTYILGTQVPETDKRVLYYNAGNTCFAMGLFERAEEMYTYVLAADPAFGSAILNRANAHMKQNDYTEAATDYRRYLAVEPDADQRQQIELLLALLDQEAADREAEAERQRQEADRLAAQNERISQQQQQYAEEKAERDAAAREAENERLAELERQLAEQAAAEEARKAADEERRRKLLEEIAQSLADNDSEGISAGTEGVIEYEYEEELD